jgi:cephalosporin-C deacetylase-like acetyl esterase
MTLAKRIVLGFCILIVTILLYLIVVLFSPVVSSPKQPIPKRKKEGDERPIPPSARQDIQFSVAGTKISAWLYLPQDTSKPVPCIVMSQGFGGTKDAVLEQYALRFIAAGTAVLTYDYRHFGASAGEPRQLYDMLSQLEDLRAAIAYARTRTEIDPQKIVLWGTSASGGYGLIIAAEDESIAAVIGQCAGLDHEADSKMFMELEGYAWFFRLFIHAQRDKGRSRLGLSPHKIPIAGLPGSTAMFTAPGAFDGYATLMSDSDTFKNEVCARLLFMGHARDPREAAKDVQCPVLLLVCENDNLVAPGSHIQAAQTLGDKAIVKSFPIGHFDIYEGQYFAQAVDETIAFLQRIR